MVLAGVKDAAAVGVVERRLVDLHSGVQGVEAAALEGGIAGDRGVRGGQGGGVRVDDLGLLIAAQQRSPAR
jgi:hypothetical protein